MLKLAGEFEVGQEKIERLSYNPQVKNTGDLEAATKTITATSEASGTGNADYSASLTLPKPDDARLVVKRIAARLAVTIDSFDTATHLYCRVYVDAQDADHRLFDMDWDSTGAKLYGDDTNASDFPTIFNLLKDGTEHTFYFFFWVNQANNAVISLVQLWEGVGTCGTSGAGIIVLNLNFSGLTAFLAKTRKIGSGTPTIMLSPTSYYYYYIASGDGAATQDGAVIIKEDDLRMYGTVATDLNYLEALYLNLRSEQ